MLLSKTLQRLRPFPRAYPLGESVVAMRMLLEEDLWGIEGTQCWWNRTVSSPDSQAVPVKRRVKWQRQYQAIGVPWLSRFVYEYQETYILQCSFSWNFSVHLMKEPPPGSIASCHPSGWMQAELFANSMLKIETNKWRTDNTSICRI
jgi:hypothetical protein